MTRKNLRKKMLEVSVRLYHHMEYLKTVSNDENYREVEELLEIYERLQSALDEADTAMIEDDF